ncbi:SU10 major capsid protein [Paenibacillus sp. DYY-L-2]|uniref:SU10 major capsid protein n=1 Tax=Paenibacillus sp. DYY-L-2 TaxID=3447013 RepID=UPI003F4FA93A
MSTFTTANFVPGQNVDLKDVLIQTTPVKTPFTTLLLNKTTKATSPTMNWIEEAINEAAAVTLGESADAPARVDDTLAPMSNYCELVGATASVSNTAQHSEAVGINDLLAKDVANKTKALKLAMEDRLINGVKDFEAATKTYKTAGILEQINSLNRVENATFTETKFLETIETMYNAGSGDNMLCYLPAQMKLKLNDFKNFQYFAKDNLAGVDVEEYVSPFGRVRFVLTEKIANKLFVVNPEYLELGILIPFHGQVEPVSGSKQSVYLETQFGLKLLNSKAAASFEIK